jgi:hypothetical protein
VRDSKVGDLAMVALNGVDLKYRVGTMGLGRQVGDVFRKLGFVKGIWLSYYLPVVGRISQ